MGLGVVENVDGDELGGVGHAHGCSVCSVSLAFASTALDDEETDDRREDALAAQSKCSD
jgi:hypothetical protein